MADILFGIHSVTAVLEVDPESIIGLYIESKKSPLKAINLLVNLARNYKIPIQSHTKQTLDKMSQNARHQGIVAQIKKFNTSNEKDLTVFLRHEKNPLILVLDTIQDPRNFGACLRSAAAAGVNGVIFPNSNSTNITPLVHHVSVGASYYLKLFQVSNIARIIQLLKQSNIWCYGLAGDAKHSLYQADFTTDGCAIIIGGEGSGLKQRTKSLCDDTLNIPMHNNVESLNISVASAIALFEVKRQQLKA